MKRLGAILIAIWLGLHIAFAYIVSPVLFTSTLIDTDMATMILGLLLDLSNVMGIMVWLMVLLQYRSKLQWRYQYSYLVKRWIVILLMSLMASLLLAWVVDSYTEHVLVNVIGGGLGVWRGSWQMVNLWIGLVGLGLSVKFLQLESS